MSYMWFLDRFRSWEILLHVCLLGYFDTGTDPGTLVPRGTSDAGVELIPVAILVYKLGLMCAGMSLICLLTISLFAGLVNDWWHLLTWISLWMFCAVVPVSSGWIVNWHWALGWLVACWYWVGLTVRLCWWFWSLFGLCGMLPCYVIFQAGFFMYWYRPLFAVLNCISGLCWFVPIYW
jgi:hypothetical protein